MAEVEETLRRIQNRPGVQAVIVVNSEGVPIRNSVDNDSALHYAGVMQKLIMMARSAVRDINPQDDLTFLRIRTKKNEIMVAPENDYFMIVVQKLSE